MDNEIMVSILCTAYNHEKYIRQCLDGFVMQKTDFKFEVIVHDDASTDKTAEIIREYEENYPDIIKPIYQTENQYSKGIRIYFTYAFPKSKGKYIALCEGDDFWIDEYKLQKQVDAMEKNLNCSMCVTTVKDVNEDGTFRNTTHPSNVFQSQEINTEEFLKLAVKEYVFQTSSYVFRGELFKEYVENPPEFRNVSPVGDWPYLLYFSLKGNIYYIEDTMSCYRRNSDNSTTTSMNSENTIKIIRFNDGIVQMIESFDKETGNVYHFYCEEFKDRFLKTCYYCYMKDRNYKKVLGKKYKSFFKQENFKDRFFIKTAAYFPFFIKLYNIIKK